MANGNGKEPKIPWWVETVPPEKYYRGKPDINSKEGRLIYKVAGRYGFTGNYMEDTMEKLYWGFKFTKIKNQDDELLEALNIINKYRPTDDEITKMLENFKTAEGQDEQGGGGTDEIKTDLDRAFEIPEYLKERIQKK